jgi:branched-chain amino acid transport system permease protein
MATNADVPRLSFAARFPVRKTILIILTISIVLGVALGSIETLQQDRIKPAAWRDIFISGVARGSIYALIAMGYTLVYGILFMINFAHGEVFMFGAFTAYFVAISLALHGFLNEHPIISLAILFLVSMLVSMIVAILLERIAYRPLRGAPRLVPLITAIGASLFLQYTARGLYGAQVKGYPRIDILDSRPIEQGGRGKFDVFGIPFDRAQLLVILAAIVLVILLYFFISKTRAGRSMRAVGEDKEIASLMGINVDRVIVTTFAIGGVLAGAAGILFILMFNQVGFTMGFIPGIKAFSAAVLGGIGNPVGAAIGGLLIGIFEAVGPILLLSGAGVPAVHQLQPVVAFGILVLVLIFRPGGILGSPDVEKA